MLRLFEGSSLPNPSERGIKSKTNFLFDNVFFLEIIIIVIIRDKLLVFPIKIIALPCLKALLFLILMNEK